MTLDHIPRPTRAEVPRAVHHRPVQGSRYAFTMADRIGIERLLRNGDTRHAPHPVILNGLLRHKLRAARGAPEPAPANLVTAGREVTYMISGENARSGRLSMEPLPQPGCILVASLLGATLIGMRVMQKVPLLRDDGRIDVVVVLGVTAPDPHDAA